MMELDNVAMIKDLVSQDLGVSIIAKSAELSGKDPDAGAYLRGSDYYATLDSKGDIR